VFGSFATSQTIDTDESNPAARFLLHILMARCGIRAGTDSRAFHSWAETHRGQYAAGKVGKEVHSRSGKDLPVGMPKRIFARQRVLELRAHGQSYRQSARQLGIGEGTVKRVLNSR
jgi:DNA invertase Pin-like site-specific DNA recombinase